MGVLRQRSAGAFAQGDSGLAHDANSAAQDERGFPEEATKNGERLVSLLPTLSDQVFINGTLTSPAVRAHQGEMNFR